MAELNVAPRGGAGVSGTPRWCGCEDHHGAQRWLSHGDLSCILRWPPKGQGVRITSVPRGGTVMESSVAS